MRRLKIIKNKIKNDGLFKTLIWLFKCFVFYVKKYFIIKKKPKSIDYKNNYIIKNNEYKKDLGNVYLFCGIPYHDIGSGQRCASLARTFDTYGFRVTYIYAYKSTSKPFPKMDIPCVTHLCIDDTSLRDISFTKNDIVIFEVPIKSFIPFLKKAKNAQSFVIYESIDNWDSSLGALFMSKRVINTFLGNADLICCTSKSLMKQTKELLKQAKIKRKKVLYLPNAVNDGIFRNIGDYQLPNDFFKGDKTLLYYGSLFGEWFDWDLLNNVALKNPHVSINVIGNYDSVRNKMKNFAKNIHFIKEKPQNELPTYLYYSDFAIIPFKPGNITDYVSPLKVFEYISMHKNIISTVIPDIRSYPNTYLSNNVLGWTKVINDISISVNHDSCDLFTMDNTWSSRVDTLLDTIYTKEKLCVKTSIIVLNYNNMSTIFKCINSLLKYIARYNYEIIVVDNGSSDGSYEKLIKDYKDNKQIKIIKNSENGCSSGRNLGVENSSGDYILFLDSDQWVCSKYWFDNYISIMLNDDSVGAVGWFAGWFNKKGYAYGSVESLKDRYNNPNIIGTSDIGYLGTGGMLTTRKIFDEVGGFDTIYDPTCYEDTDFSLKIKHKGYKLVYSKYAAICHFSHLTTNVKSKNYKIQFIKNSKLFVNKWKKEDYILIKDYKKPNRLFKKMW